MKRKRHFLLDIAASMILIVVLLAACTPRSGDEPLAGADATARPTQPPEDAVSSDDPTATAKPDENGEGENVLVRDAVITDVQVLLMESWPLQASAQIEGELGDGCTELGPISAQREGNTFSITVKTTRPAEAVCTMELRYFSESVILDILGLEAGTYTIDANGVTETFTLQQDNIGQSETDEPGAEVTLSDEEGADLVRLTLERALIDREIPDYGLLPDPAHVVLSTENIKPQFVPQLPGVTLELLSPEEIQARADAQGDFLYLRFDEMSTSQENEATVSLSNTWAVGADSDNAYLSGGGFTIEYKKEAGEWIGEITQVWIS
jgi:inhibitor of cysteine peptidase